MRANVFSRQSALGAAPAFRRDGGDLDFDFGELSRAFPDFRGLLARDVPLAFGIVGSFVRC